MKNTYPKFGRRNKQRMAMLWSGVTSLLMYGSIKTTKQKAKSIALLANRLLTKVKGKEMVQVVRTLNKYLKDELAARKCVDIILPKLKNETCVTSVHKLQKKRAGDSAEMAIVKLNLEK